MNNKIKNMSISPKGVQIIYKDGATQVIDNEGNQTITNAKLTMKNKEKSKCCNSEVENECDISPHQEPVATQSKEKNILPKLPIDIFLPKEVKKCCEKCKDWKETIFVNEKEFDIFECSLKKCPCHSSTQEPMEWWIKEFDTIFVRDDGLMNKYTYDTLGNPQNTASAMKIFISKAIKQAEERHNQDCTREECPHGNTAYCGDGCHCDGHCKMPCKWCEKEGRQKAPNNEYMEEWARASVVREIIDQLESNPNEDGSTSPNIQHWIERKQRQLRKLYQLSPTNKRAIKELLLNLINKE